MKLKYLTFFLAILACFAQPASLADPLPVEPFEAHYTGFAVLANISVPGELVMTLSPEGDDGYRMTSLIQPSGLASRLVSASEQATGELRDGAPRPLRYEHEVSGVAGSSTRVVFDWQDAVLRAEHDGERATLPLEPRVMDPLSMNLLVMTDLSQGRIAEQYTLVDETELKTYRVRRDGEEILATPLGDLHTVRVSQNRQNSTRITTFWLAPSLNYLPVQIAQEKKGKEILRMTIKDVKKLAP